MTFFDWKKEPARYKQYLEEVDNGVLIGELDDLMQFLKESAPCSWLDLPPQERKLVETMKRELSKRISKNT